MSADEELHQLLTDLSEFLNGIQIMEEYPKDGKGHRFWAMTARTWLHHGDAVALISNASKLETLKKALENVQRQHSA